MTQTLNRPTPGGLKTLFAEFGAEQGFKPKPFHEHSILLCGYQGGGKSSLVSLIDKALIFDFDGAGSTNPITKATTVPFRREASLEAVEKVWKVIGKVEELDGPRRPQWIIFDTIDSLVGLVKDYVVLEEQRKLTSKGKTEIAKDTTRIGDVAWGYQRIYDEIEPMIRRVRRCGCGLILTTYIDERTVEVSDKTGESRLVVKTEMSIPRKLLNAIKGIVDYVATISTETETIPTKTMPIKGPNGETVLGADGKPRVRILETRQEQTRVIGFRAPKVTKSQMNFPAKFRIPLPERIVLPPHPSDPDVPNPDNWKAIEEAYAQSVKDRQEVGES